jgi:hypothetical protein
MLFSTSTPVTRVTLQRFSSLVEAQPDVPQNSLESHELPQARQLLTLLWVSTQRVAQHSRALPHFVVPASGDEQTAEHNPEPQSFPPEHSASEMHDWQP